MNNKLMIKEVVLRADSGIYIKVGADIYQLKIGVGEASGYTMWSFATKVSLKTWENVLEDYNEEPPDEESLNEEKKEFPDDEVLRMFDILNNKGFVLTEKEMEDGSLWGYQVLINIDKSGNLLPCPLYDIPGKPYPKNADELKKRLIGEF